MSVLHTSKNFHRISKEHRPIPYDSKDWPSEWTTIFYKEYERFPKINLIEKKISHDLFEAIAKRRSQRDFKREAVSIEEISLLLKYSCGIVSKSESHSHRAQPSGGGRFPVEIYPIVFRSGLGADYLKGGIYHYNVKGHQLDILEQKEFSDAEINKIFTYPWVSEASFAILMTAVFWRNQNKYGERGYRYILLEAGHIGQNIYLVSEALGLKCCALAGTHDQNAEKLLDIDGQTESIIYSFAIGK